MSIISLIIIYLFIYLFISLWCLDSRDREIEIENFTNWGEEVSMYW